MSVHHAARLPDANSGGLDTGGPGMAVPGRTVLGHRELCRSTRPHGRVRKHDNSAGNRVYSGVDRRGSCLRSGDRLWSCARQVDTVLPALCAFVIMERNCSCNICCSDLCRSLRIVWTAICHTTASKKLERGSRLELRLSGETTKYHGSSPHVSENSDSFPFAAAVVISVFICLNSSGRA